MPSSVTITKNELVAYDPLLEEQIGLLDTIITIMHAERTKWQQTPLTVDLPPDKMELVELATIQEGETDD